MLRLLGFGILFAIIGIIGVFFANNGGSVEISWLGYSISTSVPFLVVFFVFVFYLWNLVVLKPLRFFEHKKEQTSKDYKYLALLNSGMAMVLSADISGAKKIEKKLVKSSVNAPLLSMAIANFENNDNDKLKYAEMMLMDKETEPFAVKTLVDIYAKNGDYKKALQYANQAIKKNPSLWAYQAVVNLEIKNENFENALKILEKGEKIIPKVEFDNMKIALLMRLADGSESSEKYLCNALKINKSFLPASMALARFYKEKGKDKKAFNVLKTAFKENPDILIYEYMAKNLANMGDIVKITTDLVSDKKDSDVAELALGKSFIKAGIWGQALLHIKNYLKTNKAEAKIALLMATVEKELGNTAEVEKWTNSILNAEVESKWRCKKCNAEFNEWQAICTNCGAFAEISWNNQKASGQEIISF